MRLNELNDFSAIVDPQLEPRLDPSSFHTGDERNPQSPDYAGQDLPEGSESFDTQFPWVTYDHQDEEHEVSVIGAVIITTDSGVTMPPARNMRSVGEFDEFDEFGDGEDGAKRIETIEVHHVTIDGETMTGLEAVQRLGEANFVGDAIGEFAEAATQGIREIDQIGTIDDYSGAKVVYK